MNWNVNMDNLDNDRTWKKERKIHMEDFVQDSTICERDDFTIEKLELHMLQLLFPDEFYVVVNTVFL